MKRYFSFSILLFLSLNLMGQIKNDSSVESQNIDEDFMDKKAIGQVITKLFDAMRAGDSSMVSECFFPEVEMYTSYTNKSGEAVLQKGDFKGFLKAIGTPHDEIWDEKIWGMEIRVDNNLAQVWTKYAFYVGEKFSHCGVDALHLSRTKEGWKIFQLADTRQRNNCEEPKK